jgi:serine protease Do
VALAAAVAMAAAAGVAQAQQGPGGRHFGGPQFDHRYDQQPQQHRFYHDDRGGRRGVQTAASDRGWLGVQIQPLNQGLADALKLADTNGALVAEVQAGSPAETGGIKAGDVILSVDGKATNDARALADAIAAGKPDTKVTVSVWRAGAKQDVAVTLGAAPGQRVAANQGGNAAPAPAPSQGTLGITIAPARGQDGGVVISGVNPNGPADRAGLEAGDQILAVGDTAVSSTADVVKAVDAAKQSGTKNVLLRVKTGQNTRFVAVQIG